MRTKKSSPARRLRRLFCGCLCLILGVIGGVLPILQGWLFILAALLLLKDEVNWIQQIITRLERKYPHHKAKARKFQKSIDGFFTKIGL